jgi:hypothetical protein
MILNGEAKQSAVAQFGKPFQNFDLKAFCPSISSEKLNIHCIHLIGFFFQNQGIRRKEFIGMQGLREKN